MIDQFRNGAKLVFQGVYALFAGEADGDESDSWFSDEQYQCDSDCSVCEYSNLESKLSSKRSSLHFSKHSCQKHKDNYISKQRENIIESKRTNQREKSEKNDHDKINENLLQDKENIDITQIKPQFITLQEEIKYCANNPPKNQSRRIEVEHVKSSQKKRKINEISGEVPKGEQTHQNKRFQPNSNKFQLHSDLPLRNHRLIDQPKNNMQILQTPLQKKAININEEKLLSPSFPNQFLRKIEVANAAHNDIERKIEMKSSMIHVARRRQSQVISQRDNASKQYRASSPITFKPMHDSLRKRYQSCFSLQNLQAHRMTIEKTLELLAEFQSLNIDNKKETINDSVITHMTSKEPDVLKLTKSQYEINKNYLETIQKIMAKASFPEDVVIKNESADYQISQASIKRLEPRKWLNDEIINAYIQLINEREKIMNNGNVFIFNTFFLTMIEDMIKRNDYSYQKLARVINRKKINLKNYKQILIPVNIKDYHWFVISIDMSSSKIQVIDSMRCSNETLYKYSTIVKRFLSDYLKQHKDSQGRIKCESNIELWISEIAKNIPQQDNGYDCGLCSCLNMEIIGRGGDSADIKYTVNDEFSQEQRKRITVELMFGKILTKEE